MYGLMLNIIFFLGAMYAMCLQKIYEKLEERKWEKSLEVLKNGRTKETDK